MEAGGHRVKKIVLSRRSEEELGLDPESWLAKDWLQVAVNLRIYWKYVNWQFRETNFGSDTQLEVHIS